MKKSTRIQLVLITAALASCNRQTVPQLPADDSYSYPITDSTLTAGPAPFIPDSTGPADEYGYGYGYEDPWYMVWNYSFNPYYSYYIGPVHSVYYNPGRFRRRGSFVHGSTSIVRGGFGKTAMASTSVGA